MVLYFSGTGNSAYAAKRIAAKLGDEATDLFGRLRARDYTGMRAERPWVVVVPTYAWRIPRVVHTWLARTALEGRREIYFVLTCGGNIGNAGQYLEKLCAGKGMRFRGCAAVVMPDNYIAMFCAPGREEALRIIRQAEKRIDRVAGWIQAGEALPAEKVTPVGRLNSGIVNDLFYWTTVRTKKFRSTEACVSCGRCAAVCPLGNIRMESGRPVWGENCTHCMACISRCPCSAIEYGQKTVGKVRYVCPKEL